MPAGKTYESIGQTVTLGSNQLDFTFTNISQNYTDLVLVGRVVASSNGTAVSFRVNNLTSTSNYGHTWMTRSNNTTYSGIETSSTYGTFGWYITPASQDGYLFIADFLNYTGTHHNKTVFSRVTGVGSNSSYLGNEVTSNQIATTSPITSIKISMQENGTATLNAGSTFTLYGIKAA